MIEKPESNLLPASPSSKPRFTHSFHKFVCLYYEPCTVLEAGDTAVKLQSGYSLGAWSLSLLAAVINHLLDDQALQLMPSHIVICFICVKFSAYIISLTSWNVPLLNYPCHSALGLAPYHCCINIVSLSTNEHRIDRKIQEESQASILPGFGWSAMTHMDGSCLLLCKQQLAYVAHSTCSDAYLSAGIPPNLSS